MKKTFLPDLILVIIIVIALSFMIKISGDGDETITSTRPIKGLEEVDVELIQQLLNSGQLSNREAEFYTPTANNSSPNKKSIKHEGGE